MIEEELYKWLKEEFSKSNINYSYLFDQWIKCLSPYQINKFRKQMKECYM